MFDGLKDKLGSFRKDVEEEVEEKEADAADEAAADAEAAEADASEDAEEPSTPAAAPDRESADDEDEDADDSGPGRLRQAAAFATGRVIIEEDDLAQPLWSLEMALLESDVEMSVAEEILDSVREALIG